jgi:hypothetical protein
MPYAPKPAFNVVEPFDGVTIVQLNSSMRKLLQRFIEEVQEVEVEVVALGKALADPVKAQELRRQNQESRRHEARQRRIRDTEDHPV